MPKFRVKKRCILASEIHAAKQTICVAFKKLITTIERYERVYDRQNAGKPPLEIKSVE
jgi:hypothetical protein